jgi:ABC-2 type transport system permease protein
MTVWAPGLWVLTAGLAGFLTATTLANDFVHSTTAGLLPAGARLPVIDALGPAAAATALVVAALGIQLVSPEYASGAIVATLLAQPRRWIVLAAKLLVAGAGALAVAVALAPTAVAGIRFLVGDALTAPIGPGRAVAGLGLVLVQAAVLGVALMFLLRSAVGALGASFLLLVVALAAPEPVGRWLPGPAAARWLDDLAAGRSPVAAGAVLVAWSVLAVGLAGWVLRRRDA